MNRPLIELRQTTNLFLSVKKNKGLNAAIPIVTLPIHSALWKGSGSVSYPHHITLSPATTPSPATAPASLIPAFFPISCDIALSE